MDEWPNGQDIVPLIFSVRLQRCCKAEDGSKHQVVVPLVPQGVLHCERFLLLGSLFLEPHLTVIQGGICRRGGSKFCNSP